MKNLKFPISEKFLNNKNIKFQKCKKRLYTLLIVISVFFVGNVDNCNVTHSINSTKLQSEIVYITKTGKCYHKSHCTCLKNSKIGIEKSKAVEQNYLSCCKCC